MATALALVGALACPAAAGAFTAGTTYTLDIKVAPASFKAGTQLDIPVYLVENRAPANGGSQLAEYNLGRVDSSFGSSQSRFLRFTPAAGLVAPTIVAQENPWIFQNGAQSLVQFRFESPGTPGLAVTPDNSGIVGRTEILIGTVRTEIGPAIPQTSGLPIVFEMTIRPAGGASGVDGRTGAGGQPGLGDIHTRQIQVFADAPRNPDGDDDENAAACDKAKRKVESASKQAARAQRNADKAGRRARRVSKAKNASKAKKAKARRQARRARGNAKKAKDRLRRSRSAAKAVCA